MEILVYVSGIISIRYFDFIAVGKLNSEKVHWGDDFCSKSAVARVEKANLLLRTHSAATVFAMHVSANSTNCNFKDSCNFITPNYTTQWRHVCVSSKLKVGENEKTIAKNENSNEML